MDKNKMMETGPRIEQKAAIKAWLAVGRAYNTCSAAITKRIAPSGFGLLQHELLINLMLYPGLSQQELASRCFSAKSGVSAIVGEFEQDGFVVRRASESDARVKQLFLTEKGLKQARTHFDIQNEIIEAMAGLYTPDGLTELEEGMNASTEMLKERFL